MLTDIPEPRRRANPLLQRVTLVHGDITEQKVDAIGSLLPVTLQYRGEVNAALLKAAGPGLDNFVTEHIYRPKAGDVYVVPGFNLSAKHVLFAMTPPWKNDFDREEGHLTACVRGIMETARAQNFSVLAIPPLGAGRHGFPKPRAARIIVQAILDRLHEDVREIRITCKLPEAYQVFRERLLSVGWSDLQP